MSLLTLTLFFLPSALFLSAYPSPSWLDEELWCGALVAKLCAPTMRTAGSLAEDEVLESVEELLRILVLPLEVVGVVNFLDVLLECGAVGPGLQRAVVHRLNGLN